MGRRSKDKRSNKYNSGAFSSVPIEIQKSAAFQSLPASALRVLLWALNKNYRTVSKMDIVVKPTFKLTNVEAKTELGMNSTTFTYAKNQLAEKGFLEWVKRGGLKGCNGECSIFSLSGKWKEWEAPPKKQYKNLELARSILKKNKIDNKSEEEYGKTLKNNKPGRRVVRRNRLSLLD